MPACTPVFQSLIYEVQLRFIWHWWFFVAKNSKGKKENFFPWLRDFSIRNIIFFLFHFIDQHDRMNKFMCLKKIKTKKICPTSGDIIQNLLPYILFMPIRLRFSSSFRFNSWTAFREKKRRAKQRFEKARSQERQREKKITKLVDFSSNSEAATIEMTRIW